MSKQEVTDTMTDEELKEAMELLKSVPETTATSPTLSALDEARRPKIKTACEECPNSMWFSSPQEVKCYCRVMHMISWSAKEPNLITRCDGIFLQ